MPAVLARSGELNASRVDAQAGWWPDGDYIRPETPAPVQQLSAKLFHKKTLLPRFGPAPRPALPLGTEPNLRTATPHPPLAALRRLVV